MPLSKDVLPKFNGVWIDQQENQMLIQFEKAEQEVLLKAKRHCLNLIYLNKKLIAMQ